MKISYKGRKKDKRLETDMNIGTLSLNINTEDLNYGAILHSWAFIEYLLKYTNIDNAEIINYTSPQLELFDKTHPALSYLKSGRISSFIKMVFASNDYIKRARKFENFINKYMHVSGISYNKEKLENSKLNYDCLICESDVIWSPRFFNGILDDTFFLALNNMASKKKIIYAASTANADFNEQERETFISLIKYPDYISCRETYGTNFIHECGRKDAVTVVDPVLLLKPSDYDNICEERIVDGKYVLVYIPLNYDSRYMRAADAYAKKYNLKVVEISYYVLNKLKHKVIADASVGEFLTLIKNAEVVFTNSFHAVCFSCLYHVQFYAFERKTGRKTEDLCSRLGISDHYMKIEDYHECLPIDFSNVDENLERERKFSIEWLNKALSS